MPCNLDKQENGVMRPRFVGSIGDLLQQKPNRPLLRFAPAKWLRGGHRQTLLGYLMPGAQKPRQTRLHLVPVGGGDHIVLCENLPHFEEPVRGIVLLMHGLGGEANSPYMLRISSRLRQNGFVTFRMNHRGAGEGRGFAKELYHAGKSEDLAAALAKIVALYPRLPLLMLGFSLSGNILLKLLGENLHPLPPSLCAAIAINPPIDLAKCTASLRRLPNRIYDYHIVRALKKVIKMRQRDYPAFPQIPLPRCLTMREFDEICSAPLCGFRSAADYYEKCSAKQFLAGIRLPTLILASADDPFIPKESFEDLPVNDFITLHITDTGGHLGFVSHEKTVHGHQRWMDYAVTAYTQHCIEWHAEIQGEDQAEAYAACFQNPVLLSHS